MKVEQLNNVQIDWTKPQVVVNSYGNKYFIVTNQKPIDEFHFCGVHIGTGSYSNKISKKDLKPENATQYPIELKLTIESESELCNLILRASVNYVDVNKIHESTTIQMKYKSSSNDYNLFSLLDDLAKERNLYKND